tara:strand:- start:4677 stop:6374 length:1698 start_codon:yes stop_codon:yes gene_type:complete
MEMMHRQDDTLVQKWEPVLEGIDNDYTRRVTAQLLENQAKSIVEDRLSENITAAATTTGQLGTFQKFAFPLVRRVYPKLLANSLVGVQPMQGPVSQVFYLGNSRAKNGGETPASDIQTVYSKFNLTYAGNVASAIGSLSASPDGTQPVGSNGGYPGTFELDAGAGATGGLDGDSAAAGFDVSNVLAAGESGDEPFQGAGAGSGTMGGQIAAWPNPDFVGGYNLSGGERLAGTGIPEMTFHIEQEAVVANTRKMRALWTLEASQDLKAYHNLDLERELTDLLSKELQLEIDRELIEDLRMISYGLRDRNVGGVNQNIMDSSYISLGDRDNGVFPGLDGNTAATGTFVPAQFTYDFNGANGTGTATSLGSAKTDSNVFVVDFTTTAIGLYPRHVGEVYANLLAVINLASQDIYRTTMRGPGNWLLTSPLVASMLESAAKLEGGIMPNDAPTNIGRNSIEYKGKFMGRYDLYVDPMYPSDEIMMGYKGANAMDSGYIYAPYIPLQQLPTITDPETFQPRKGILTRYGKVQIEPMNRFYRIIRIIGPTSNYLFSPFARNNGVLGTATTV